MSHGATPDETYFAAPLHMFQLKVSTCTIKKKGDFFCHYCLYIFVTVSLLYFIVFTEELKLYLRKDIDL